MKKRWPFLAALILAAPHAAYATRQQTKISGAQTEAHVSGANTPQGNKNGTIHASGAATSATGKKASDAGKVVDAIGKAVFAKDAGKNAPRHPSTVTHEFSDNHPAPGEVRQPRPPKQAAVEPPRSPDQPHSPDIPKLK